MFSLRDQARGALATLTPPLVLNRREARRREVSRRQLNLMKAWHLQLLPSVSLLENGLIIDVGAHEGLWTRDVLEIVPSATIIAVEPQDDLRAQIERRFEGDPRVSVDHRALADSTGTRTFHRLDASVNGSLYPPRSKMNELYRTGWELQETHGVETTTVDELSSGRHLALLKIDVQGAELEVLEGAHETLARTSAAMLEVTFVSHYEGDTTFSELHEFMVAAGFALTGISPPARSPAGAMLTADAAYVSTERLADTIRANARGTRVT